MPKPRKNWGFYIFWPTITLSAPIPPAGVAGRRSEEQIEVMRKLWTQELVTFEGRWHKIIDAGINPLPVQRPIPIWFGGSDDRALRRLAKLGDGWFPLMAPDDKCRAAIEKIRLYTREAGRNPDDIGIEGRIGFGQGSPDS